MFWLIPLGTAVVSMQGPRGTMDLLMDNRFEPVLDLFPLGTRQALDLVQCSPDPFYLLFVWSSPWANP